MTHPTTDPVDIDTMRASIALLLPRETVTPPAEERLSTLTVTLRGHMNLLIPEVEQLTARLPADDVPRYCALACVGEARRKLRARPAPGPYEAVAHARRLARSLAALCDHFEALNGDRICVMCDRQIRTGDETVPYDRADNRIHAVCAQLPHRVY